MCAEKPNLFNIPRYSIEAITFKLRQKMLSTLKKYLNALVKTINIITIKQLKPTFATSQVH